MISLYAFANSSTVFDGEIMKSSFTVLPDVPSFGKLTRAMLSE